MCLLIAGMLIIIIQTAITVGLNGLTTLNIKGQQLSVKFNWKNCYFSPCICASSCSRCSKWVKYWLSTNEINMSLCACTLKPCSYINLALKGTWNLSCCHFLCHVVPKFVWAKPGIPFFILFLLQIDCISYPNLANLLNLQMVHLFNPCHTEGFFIYTFLLLD